MCVQAVSWPPSAVGRCSAVASCHLLHLPIFYLVWPPPRCFDENAGGRPVYSVVLLHAYDYAQSVVWLSRLRGRDRQREAQDGNTMAWLYAFVRESNFDVKEPERPVHTCTQLRTPGAPIVARRIIIHNAKCIDALMRVCACALLLVFVFALSWRTLGCDTCVCINFARS